MYVAYAAGVLCLVLVLLTFNSILSEDLMTKKERNEYLKCKEPHKKNRTFRKCDEALLDALTMLTIESKEYREKNKCTELKPKFDCLRNFTGCESFIKVAYESECNSIILIVSLVVGIFAILLLVCGCSFCVYKCYFGTRVIDEKSAVVLPSPKSAKIRGVPNRTELMTRCSRRMEMDAVSPQKVAHS